jgi:hypothetical protein
MSANDPKRICEWFECANLNRDDALCIPSSGSDNEAARVHYVGRRSGICQEAALGGFPRCAPRSWFSAWRRLASISIASASEGILDAI